MKIAQIITELRPAGAERIVAGLTLGLKKNGHSVMVVSLKPLPEESVIVDCLTKSNIEIKSLNITGTAPFGIFRLRKILAEYKPDIVHSHLFHANFVARLNAFNRAFKLINTVHIAERRPGKWWQFATDNITAFMCDCITCVSEAVSSFYSKKAGISPEELKVIYNGISPPPPLSPGRRKKLRKDWAVSDCNRVIGSVGRLARQKGFDIFLDILSGAPEIVPEGEKWGVVILGEGPERKILEKKATELPGVFKPVLPGFRADAAECIGAFDLFVMPSRYEGFGLTLAEAMAHGIPVAVNDIDSLPELTEKYPAGQVLDFTAGNPRAAGIIAEMTKRPFGEPYRGFSLEKMVSEYLALYESFL
jgi:glycosyltransferase involved in cell wall biosynthesis